MTTPAQWIAGARLRTLPAALAPVLVGTGAAVALHGFDPVAAVLALVVALALQVAVNYANDYSDGRLTVTGRLDDVVITGGVNVAPSAVVAVLRDHPAVADAVVVGRPDDEWGQRVVAAVVPTRGAAPELPELRAWVADRLGPPAAPRQLHLIDAVPLLHTGKPDRRAVAAQIPEV